MTYINGTQYNALIGFFILYNDISIRSKINFTIYSNSIFSINNQMIFEIYFKQNFLQAILSEFSFDWSTDRSSNMSILNGNSLSLFLIKINDYGMYNIYCRVTHLSSKQSVQSSYNVKIPAPPIGGTCRVTPSIGVAKITKFVFYAAGWTSDEINISGLIYKYGYLGYYDARVQLNRDNDTGNLYSSMDVPSSNTLYCQIYSNNYTFTEILINVSIVLPIDFKMNYEEIITLSEDDISYIIDVII